MSRDRLMLGLSTFFLGLGFVVIVLISPVWGIAGTINGHFSTQLPETTNYVSGGWRRPSQAFLISITLVLPFCTLTWGVLYIFRERYAKDIFKLRLGVFFIWATALTLLFIWGPGSYSNIAGWQIDQAALSKTSDIIHFPFWVLGRSVVTSLMVIVWFSFSAVAIGARLISVFEPKWRDFDIAGYQWFITQFLVGQAVLSIIFVFLAIEGFLSLYSTTLVIVLGFIMGANPLTQSLKMLAQDKTKAQTYWSHRTRSEKYLIGLILGVACLSLSNAWLSLGYDAATHYLASARLTAIDGKIHYIASSYAQYTGFHAEMELAGLMIFAERSARVLTWLMGIIFLVECKAIAQLLKLSERSQLIFIAMVISFTATVDLFGSGKTDMIGMALGTCALYWAIQHNAFSSKISLLLVGFLATLAILNRPHLVISLGVLISGAIIWRNFFDKTPLSKQVRIKRTLNTFALLAVPAIGLGIIHVIRNILLFHEPLVPFFYLKNSVENSTLNGTLNNWELPKNLLYIRLTFPFYSTFFAIPEGLGNLTPFMLIFGPLIAMIRIGDRLKNQARLFCSVSLVSLLIWYIFSPIILETRYIILFWCFIFIPIALALDKFMELGGLAYRLSYIIIAIVLCVLMIRSLYGTIFSPDLVSANQGQGQCTTTDQCRLLHFVNKTVEPNTRILMLTGYQSYLRTDLLACELQFEEYEILRQAQNQGSYYFWETVHQLGFEFLTIQTDAEDKVGNYVNQSNIFLYPKVDETPKWLHLEPLWATGDFTLYRLDATASAPPQSLYCEKTKQNRWSFGKTHKESTR